jgi:GNAT superfamily N-acetyltransferase
MCDEWMPVVRLPIAFEQFAQLPHNAAYRYEYLDGAALLSPRPRFYHAVLDLETYTALESSQDTATRCYGADDWPALEALFVRAFARWQPFAGLDEVTLQRAAAQSLKKTRSGGDGPLIEAACMVAERGSDVVGATLLTFLPDGDPCEWSSYYWNEPPPDDLQERREGRPHLTWIFVTPQDAGTGVGSSLLKSSVESLRALGYHELYSTFLLGNDSSLLWHWRNGFRLLSYPGSLRRSRRRTD